MVVVVLVTVLVGLLLLLRDLVVSKRALVGRGLFLCRTLTLSLLRLFTSRTTSFSTSKFGGRRLIGGEAVVLCVVVVVVLVVKVVVGFEVVVVVLVIVVVVVDDFVVDTIDKDGRRKVFLISAWSGFGPDTDTSSSPPHVRTHSSPDKKLFPLPPHPE